MKPLLLVIIISLLTISCFAQDEKAIEKDLVSCFKKRAIYNDSMLLKYGIDPPHVMIISTKDSGMTPFSTPIVPVDTNLANRVLYYTSKYPVTLTADFQLLQAQDVNIMSSDDSLFRIYVWEEQHNMVRRFYRAVFQYKAGSKVNSCLLPHADTSLTRAAQAFFDNMYTLVTATKTYYLATYVNKYTATNREEGVKVFAIDSNKVKGKMKYHLNDTVHLFKTKTGLHNELSYKYDIVASGDAGSDNGISYDSASQSIEIPVITESGKMTESHITYKFKGQYFERVLEEEKPKKKKLKIKN
ncbi:MAG TPA: hypothetical protein VNZ45_14425 [Bacteroidia bacterium]|nr:hypothetical protein [Bacteroidia bacterium]